MTSKGREYRYYGCSHMYDRRTGLEVRTVLADPSVVLHKLTRQDEADGDSGEVEAVKMRLASHTERERRLVTLFSFGEVDERLVREQIAEIRRERAVLEDRLRSLRPAPAVELSLMVVRLEH